MPSCVRAREEETLSESCAEIRCSAAASSEGISHTQLVCCRSGTVSGASPEQPSPEGFVFSLLSKRANESSKLTARRPAGSLVFNRGLKETNDTLCWYNSSMILASSGRLALRCSSRQTTTTWIMPFWTCSSSRRSVGLCRVDREL